MSNILGSTGDYYQMLQQSAATTRQVKINKNNLDALNRSVPLGEDETKKERVSSVLNQGFKKEENNVSQETRAVDNGLNTEVSDTGTSANPGLQDIIGTTLNIQRMWLGDDYEWDANEARDFTTLLRLSEDPKATASRYIASKGLATNLGLDTKTVYDNLDEISQYYIGDVYDAHEVSFFQKIKNGFIRNDAMSLKYEYMLADQAGDTARAEELKKQIEEKEAELGDYTSAIPTSIYDKIETAVLENFAYMTQPALEGSLVSSVITALGIATAAAFPISAPAILAGTASIAGAGAVAMSGKQMYEWGAGDKYYSLMNDEEYKGVKNKGQAYLLATIEGVATAAIETVMDGMSSRLLGKVTGNQISKIGINSIVDLKRRGVTSRAANAVYDWVTGALDEGFMNEAPEYILGELTSIIYKNSNGIADEKTWADRRDELMESIVDGIIVGGVYGALAIPSSLKSQRSMAIELRRTANASESLSEFQNATKDMKPEGLSDADFDTARTTIWNASQNQKREYLQKEFGGTVLESEEIASKELFSTVDPMTGEDAAKVLPDGTVYRTDDNALYSEVQTDNKSGTQTVWYGNPDDGSVYGIVQVSSDGDTQTIESVRVRAGYEGIRSEMVKDALGNTLSTETNVEWNPTTKGLQSVKEELINNNPNKTGLVYSSQTRGRDSDIQSLKTQIKAASPQLTDAEATMAARLTSIADVGTGTIKYEKATAENTKRNPADIRGATNLAKALIYTGQNADSSTFVHELFHAVASVRVKEAENLSNEIRTALQEEGTRSQLETFIKNNLAVWGAGANINTIMSSLSEIKENSNAKGWSVAQNENLARLYEAYRRSERSIRQSLPQAIRNLLEKLTQFMNKVYGTLKDTVPLNENIAKAYDSLMGFEDMSSETKRVESQGVFKEFQGLREKAEDNTLLQDDNDHISITLFQNKIEDSTLESLRAFSEGNTSASIESKELGTVIYEIGSTGKHGHGMLHIIEKRMAEGKSLEEATDIAIAVAESVASGDITASIQNTRHLDKGGIRAIVAIKDDGNIVITGYDIINKDEKSDAYRRSESYASETHVRSDQMVASFNDRLNQLLEKRNTIKEKYDSSKTNLTREQWIQTRTENFRKWFKDSKVVDENGDPLVVYHGTPNAGFDVFESATDNNGDFSSSNPSILFQSKVSDSFEEQLEKISKEDIGVKDKTIVFSDSTPAVFTSLGLEDLSVEMYADKLARGLLLSEDETHGHSSGLSKEIVRNISKELGNPLAVFDSASVKGRLVALYDISDLKGDSVIVSIFPKAKKSNSLEINLLSSIYGKENKSVFSYWVDKGLLRYVDNTREKSLALRLQLPSTKTLYNENVLTKSELVNENIILAQDKLLEDIDSVADIESAEALAREEYESEREVSLSEADKKTAEHVFDIDSSLPDNWENIYESDSEDRLQKERELEESLPESDITPSDMERIEAEENEVGLIRGRKNLGSSYRLFVEGNSPDIIYEGKDTHKDTIFKNAIKDEAALRQYLAIMGEAYLYDTSATNRVYEDAFNSQWNRWESVPVTVPYIDDAYRQTLHERLTAQLSDRGLAGAMKSALTNADMSDAVIKKAQKELSDNARFYRNILALLMKREDMLPDSLITEVKGLDIPSRESLDIASVTEFAELARKVNNERLRQKILSGTAKFGSDEDQAKYKELVTYTKELDKDIREKTKEIESLEKKGEEYEKKVKELEELNKERMEILLDAEEIFNLLTDTFVPEVKNKEYRQQLAKNYSDLMIKYEMLSPTRESELQSAWTQSQVKEGGHAGWRQQYRGAKYGSEAWLKEITENYEDVKERIDAEYNKNRRQSYNKVAKEVIETVRSEVRKELNEARMQLIASSTRTLTMNSNKIYSTLAAIKSIADGTGAVIPKVDIEAMKATEKELVDLQKKVSKQETKIENLKEKQKQEIYDARTEERIKAAKSEQALRDRAKQAVWDARTEERWKAAKEKQAIFAKQAEDLVNQQYVVKRTIENLKEKQKQEIKDLKEEQRQKEKEKRAYQAIRDEKQKIANYIMRPVSLKSVDYSKAKEIQAIQALIDPEFRREWIYDIKKDPAQNPHYGTMTVQQAKDYLNSLSDSAKTDLFFYMPQDLVERLTEQRKPLNDWTIAELEQMASSVEMLKNEGRAILQAKKDMRNAQAREIKRSILKAMGADSNNDGGSIPSSLQRLSEGKGFKARLHSIMFRTRRMQELAQLLDGGYGNKGAAYRLLVEEKRWHQDNEAAAIKKRYDAVEGFVNDKAIDRMTEKVTVDLGRGKTADFTVDQLAYAWLSQYDEENKAAVMYGSLMTEGEKGTIEQKSKDIDIMTGESTITREWLLKRSELIEDDEEFMKVARERYDALIKTAEKELTDRGLWDLVNAINKDFNNSDNTKRLDAASIEYFNTPLSSKENYLPIKRMAMTGENLDNATADSMFNLNANKVVRDPAKGFLIERIDIAPRHQKQVDMSLLGVWQNSVKEQEHLIEFAGYVKKLRSVFESQKSSEVEREVNKRWSPALMREVKDYIELVANPDSSTKKDPTNELFKTIRGRTGAAYLGWKVSGIVLQGITSPASAFSELKPWEVFGAYAQIGAHPLETIKTINEKSQMMKNRTMNQIVDEAVQRRNEWTQSKTSRRLNKFEEVGQIGLTLVDRYAVAGPWLAMYERTLREGDKLGLDTATSETRAVQKADEFILRTQPVGDPTELASFFRTKSEAAKTILQFQTSLNVVWNNITANTVGFIRQKRYASAIGNIVGYAVAGVLLGLVQNGYDDDDDGKDKALKTIYWSLSQGVGSIPVAGSSIDSLSKYLITGDYDWYMNKGISISPLYDKAVQALVAATGGDGWKALERSAEAVGIGMGLPVSGAKEFYAIVSEKSLAPLVGRE